MPSSYTDFFHEPLTEDVEELLSRFQSTDSVRYGAFSAIWREMKFSDIFLGTTNNSEMKRFCRVALATAVKYFLPPHSYHIRVGGLYLMFAFYHTPTQPASTPVRIRLALKDWRYIQRFLTESKEAEHHDVLYIYHKLAATKVFHYTAMPHFLTFQKQKTKPEVQCKQFLSKASSLQELQSTEILEEMADIQSHYEKLKEATQVRVHVNMTHPDFTSRLKQCMNEFFSWQQQRVLPKEKNVGGEVYDPEEDCSSRARLLSSIKQKSYSNVHTTSKSRRHREVEKAESSSSDGEQVQKPPRRKTHASLRARTWKNLGKTDEKSNTKIWLLSTPEQRHGVPLRKMSQAAAYTEYKVMKEAG